MAKTLQQKFDSIVLKAVDDITSVKSIFDEKLLYGAVFVRAYRELKQDRPDNTSTKNWSSIISNIAKAKTSEVLKKRSDIFVKVPQKDGRETYTTKQIIEDEAKIIEISKRIANNGKNGLSEEEREQAAQDFREFNREFYGSEANDGKLNAIRDLLDKGDLKIIDGPPGSGKSTVLEGVTRALAKTKRGVPNIFATGSTDKAASAMYSDIYKATYDADKSKVKGGSLDGIIRGMNNGKISEGCFVVVDEAGMLGTHNMAKLLEAAEKSKVRLILMGDAKQLPPSEGGEPYRILTEYMRDSGEIKPSYLTQTLRQKAQDEKIASEAFRGGDALRGLKIYDSKSYTDVSRKDFEENVKAGKTPSDKLTYNPIKFAENSDETLSGVAKSYLDWYENRPIILESVEVYADTGIEPKPEDAVAITIDRTGAKKVNHEIREGLKKIGAITDSRLFETAKGSHKEFGVSEKVIFSEKVVVEGEHRQKVSSGTTGTIENISKEGNISVRLEDNRLVKLEKEHLDALNYSYCVDVRTSQGMSKERAFVGVDRKVDLAEMMVAMTRHQRRVSVVIDKSVYPDLETLAKDASIRNDKDNVIDIAPKLVLKHKYLKGASR
ncbi:MAG: AAA family ATPase [Alphaproteobacteria bacterium]